MPTFLSLIYLSRRQNSPVPGASALRSCDIEKSTPSKVWRNRLSALSKSRAVVLCWRGEACLVPSDLVLLFDPVFLPSCSIVADHEACCSNTISLSPCRPLANSLIHGVSIAELA
jgi:hypothetical protein